MISNMDGHGAAQPAASQLDPGSFQAVPDSTASSQGTPSGTAQLDPGSFQAVPDPSQAPSLGQQFLDEGKQRFGSDVDIIKGALHGAAATGAGLMNTAEKFTGGDRKLDEQNPDAFTKTRDWLEQHSQNTGETPGDQVGQNIGYGGETLAEYLGGDAALKVLSIPEKLGAIADTWKILEKSPRLLQTLKLGAAAAKAGETLSPEEAALIKQYPKLAKLVGIGAEALRAGTVQGAQTTVRTGGDLGAGAEAGATMAGTVGVLGAAGAGLSAGASKVGKYLGKTAKTAGDLAEVAENAPDDQSLVENIQGRLQNAKTQLHATYNSGIEDLQDRLGGATTPASEGPLNEKAAELLQNPDPEDHPYTTGAKVVSKELLSPKVKELLQNIADGKLPLTDEDIEAAETQNKNKPNLLDHNGKAIESPDVEPEGQDAPDWNIENLVRFRQAIGKAARDSVPGSPDQKALDALLWDRTANNGLGGSAVDDTIDQLAQQSDDPQAVQDYQALRNRYRDQISRYDNPVIKNLMAGKPDEAAAAFLRYKSASGAPKAGVKDFNLDNLKSIIGPEATRNFSMAVFDNLLKKTSDGNGFNAANFVGLWNKLEGATKTDLFGANTPEIGPKDYAETLAKDAKTAAQLQKLTRAGVVGTAASVGALHPAIAGLGTLLSFVLGHTKGEGGIETGRKLVDYVANHPKVWNAFRAAGKAAEAGSPRTAIVGNAIQTGAKAAVNISNGADAARQALSTPNPKNRKPLTALTEGGNPSDPPPTSPDNDVPSEVKNAVTTVPVQVKQGAPISDPNNRGGGVPIANVDQGAGNNTIEVNRPQDFGPAQKAHELVHVWQNNLPPSIQSKIPDDPKDNSAFDISDVDSLRKQGKTLVDIPREKAATIVQKFTEAKPGSATRKKLQPWVDDMGNTPLSSTQPTAPDATRLNMNPRAPGLPGKNVAGMQ